MDSLSDAEVAQAAGNLPVRRRVEVVLQEAWCLLRYRQKGRVHWAPRWRHAQEPLEDGILLPIVHRLAAFLCLGLSARSFLREPLLLVLTKVRHGFRPELRPGCLQRLNVDGRAAFWSSAPTVVRFVAQALLVLLVLLFVAETAVAQAEAAASVSGARRIELPPDDVQFAPEIAISSEGVRKI